MQLGPTKVGIASSESAPEFGQAEASAGVFLEEEGAFGPGEFDVTAVYEIDPPHESAYPKLGPNGEFDQLAFFHKPYYTLVEVAPYRAAAAPSPVGRRPLPRSTRRASVSTST